MERSKAFLHPAIRHQHGTERREGLFPSLCPSILFNLAANFNREPFP
jgi:hypothetical protein